MHNQNLEQTWKSQPLAPININAVGQSLFKLGEKQERFRSVIRRRDNRELLIALTLVPVWFWLGQTTEQAWTWYLMIPVLLWIVGCLYWMKHRQNHLERGHMDRTLAENLIKARISIEMQIRYLSNVFWWYAGPIGVALILNDLYRFVHGQNTLVEFLLGNLFTALVITLVVWLNLHTVKRELVPMRDELDETLRELDAIAE